MWGVWCTYGVKAFPLIVRGIYHCRCLGMDDRCAQTDSMMGLFLLFPEGIGWDCCVFFASLRQKDEQDDRDYDGHGISSVVGIQLS
jgi:hypothetical protein